MSHVSAACFRSSRMIKCPAMKAFKRLSYFFLPIPLAAAAVAEEKSIRIGYAECVATTNYPKAITEKSAQLKWYFAHASVGANMVDGLTDLHGTSKATYPFQSISAD